MDLLKLWYRNYSIVELDTHMNKYHESVNVLIPRPSHKGYHKGLTENYSRAQTFLFSEKNFEI